MKSVRFVDYFQRQSLKKSKFSPTAWTRSWASWCGPCCCFRLRAPPPCRLPSPSAPASPASAFSVRRTRHAPTFWAPSASTACRSAHRPAHPSDCSVDGAASFRRRSGLLHRWRDLFFNFKEKNRIFNHQIFTRFGGWKWFQKKRSKNLNNYLKIGFGIFTTV